MFGAIETSWLLGLPVAFVLGVFLGASPLTWPILAAAVGTRAATSDDTSHAAGRNAVLALGAGMTLVYASLGFAASNLDRYIREGLGAWAGITYAALATVAILGGVALLVRPNLLCRVPTGADRASRGPVSAFLLGIPLGMVNCPACAGVITGVTVAAATAGSTVYATTAMVVFGLGHTLALWLTSGLLLRPVRVVARHAATVQRAGAVLLVGAGIFYAWQAAGSGLTVGPTLP